MTEYSDISREGLEDMLEEAMEIINRQAAHLTIFQDTLKQIVEQVENPANDNHTLGAFKYGLAIHKANTLIGES